MSDNETYTIRPAGRHVLTIGKELIQDKYAAIVELVKNAYDADSPDVNIQFTGSEDRSGYKVVISDQGHGMSRDTVINKWMVPSTDDKLNQKTSRSGKRVMQGRKGIGRYAASILGVDLFLETITPEGKKTTVYLIWKNFEDAQFLDDVEVLIETVDVSEESGTKLTIKGDESHLLEWDDKQFNKLRFELKKLTSPVGANLEDNGEDPFRINLTINQFENCPDVSEEIEPYPIFDLYDYKISGNIDSNGFGTLSYSLQKARNTVEEKVQFDTGSPSGCGKLFFDIRVYDREKEAIEALISRGLKDEESGEYVGKRQARQLLDKYNGIGVYRNGFRIRPLGDPDFDWLRLNEQRVQNPSMRIGSNQVIGYVQIQSEEQSGLIEKSARDGLREDQAFEQLKSITKKVVGLLEERRFAYRQKAGLSRPALKVERELERLFSFDELKRGIKKKLLKSGVNSKAADDIIEIISKEEEAKNKLSEDIRQAVAVYQGQASLGKIINVILHEGRRPLNFFKNQIPNLRYWHDSYLKTGDPKKLDKFMPIAEGVGNNADIFSKLFGRLDPLAAGKRSARKSMILIKTIEDTFAVFEEEMNACGITATVSGDDVFKYKAWPQDIYSIFTNLIDNSVYWINEKKSPIRQITITLVTDDDQLLYIDYRDTGPGIEPSHLESEVIFEPQFSTKPAGTGLGLAIAGESAYRNNLELKALESDVGAYFRLQPVTEVL